jgi:hypothetical protein
MIHLNCTASRESHVVIKIEFPINLFRPIRSKRVKRANVIILDRTVIL